MAEMFSAFPLSPGLVDGKHRRSMGLAIWEFLWFLEHVTSDEPDGNGKFDGVVDFGNPISAAKIALEIASSPRNVQRNIQKLVSTGYLVRQRALANGNSYIVKNSKRWLWKREHLAGIPTLSQSDGATEYVAGVRRNPSPDATESVTRRDGICRSNKERKSRRAEEQNLFVRTRGRSDLVALSTKKKTKTKPCGEEAIKLAALLRDEILRNSCDFKITPAQLQSWEATADRMIRIDGRDPEKAATLIRWAQGDDFWMRNILSMEKFRKQFDQLAAKARPKNGKPQQKPPRSAAGQVIEQFERFTVAANGGGRPQ
jgi:hypothetical protein